jgi:undecaprenyl-diphosphatase
MAAAHISGVRSPGVPAETFFLPVPPVPSAYGRAEDFAPLSVVERSYPYPSGHALRATIVLGALYLLGRSGPLRARIALVLLGLLASRVYLGVRCTGHRMSWEER